MAAVVALHCHCHASQQKGEKKILAFFFFLFVVLGGFRHCPAAPGTIRHGALQGSLLGTMAQDR